MFQKYPSIENHYQSKWIDMWIERYPELENVDYIILEKIHGTNFSLIFNNKNIQIASRNGILNPETDKFFNIFNDILYNDQYDDLFEFFKTLSKYQIIQLYGEYFGPGINKGINYGSNKQIRFFDIRIDGYLQSQYIFQNSYMRIFDDYIVPRINLIKNLNDALNFDVENVNSKLTPIEYNKENTWEGIVIKPLNKVYISPVGETFIIKKKTKKFMEKKSEKKKEVKQKDPRISELNSEFRRFLTDQRLQNVFSKYGVISNKEDISKYIKLLLEDAKEDFFKEFEIPKDLDSKAIFNVGGEPFNLLKEYI